jgi:acyl dehydratase
MQFGRTYEEFEVGAVYKHWPGKTVTEYDNHLFCLVTMNHHPLSSRSKPDRGFVQVETRGYKQDGTLVCVFRRTVMVPTETYVKEHGGEQPGRPEPAPEPL